MILFNYGGVDFKVKRGMQCARTLRIQSYILVHSECMVSHEKKENGLVIINMRDFFSKEKLPSEIIEKKDFS